jgi:drug/metabolite transporter (DMT)-like permease
VLVVLIWSSTWLVIKEGLHDLPPLLSAGLRFVLAALVMAGVAKVLARREGGDRPARWLVLVMGVTNFAISYGATYWAETELDSGLVAVLWATFPLFVAMQAHLLIPEERLRRGQGIGFLVALMGVVALFFTDLMAQGARASWTAGLMLIGPLAASTGTVLVKRHGRGTSSLLLNRDAMTVGAVLLLAAHGFFERGASVEFTARATLSIAYLAVAGTVVTFGLYFWLMRTVAAYRMGLISYVIPVLALWIGATLGDERLRPGVLVGTALILLGVGMANGTLRRPRKP